MLVVMFAAVATAQSESTWTEPTWSRRAKQVNQRRVDQKATTATVQDATLFVDGLKWRTPSAQRHRQGFRAIGESTAERPARRDGEDLRVRAFRAKRSQVMVPQTAEAAHPPSGRSKEGKGKASKLTEHGIVTAHEIGTAVRGNGFRQAAPISTFAPASASARIGRSSTIRPIAHHERVASIHLGPSDNGRRPLTVAQAQEADEPDLEINLDFLDPNKIPEPTTDAPPTAIDPTTPEADLDDLQIPPPSPDEELRPEDLIPPDQGAAEMTQDDELRSILGEPSEPVQEAPSTVDDPVIERVPRDVPEATIVEPREEMPESPVYPFDLPQDEGVTCDRIYLGRDCCEEDENCANVIRFLRSRSIANISLDITPPYRPGETDSTSYDQNGLYSPNGNVDDGLDEQIDDNGMRRNLSDSPSRSWLDQNGQLLAEGQLADFRNGEIYVQHSDGTTKIVRYDQLGNDELCFLSAWWNTPTECRLDDSRPYDRNWLRTTFTWTASSLCHKPLYFEDEQLERYGHSAGPFRQPILSAAHFFSKVMLLPYNMGVHPPNECIYDLGHYRPGNCAPWMVPAFPLSVRGLRYQASAIAGISALMP